MPDQDPWRLQLARADIHRPPGRRQVLQPQWGSHVTVNSVDAVLSRCGELGGSTLVPPMDVPGDGRMAALRDPQGAVLIIMAYR